jgi:hypothetical protein
MIIARGLRSIQLQETTTSKHGPRKSMLRVFHGCIGKFFPTPIHTNFQTMKSASLIHLGPLSSLQLRLRRQLKVFLITRSNCPEKAPNG